MGLSVKEPLIFEMDEPGATGVNVRAYKAPPQHRLGPTARDAEAKIGLPNISEGRAIRHYVRLSQLNYGIDTGFYPLGSCTMKYNPRVNEVAARLPGFAHCHPLQPPQTIQGALKVIHELSEWLMTVTGMPAVAMTPAAGSHGELCGIMAIRRALQDRGETDRNIILTPTAAHGTNPATAAMAGFKVVELKGTAEGRVDMDDFYSKLSPKVAGIMLTNPNTCGLFEKDVLAIGKAMRENDSYFYMDGANLNAILGRVRPGDMGVDCMHINLHKTFSTPHGGGGPGSGPTVLSDRLAKYAPIPNIVMNEDGVVSEEIPEKTLGRMKTFLGQFGMHSRALAYCKAHGAEGLRHVAGDAVLNANYASKRLSAEMSRAFPNSQPMHEAIFSDAFLKGTGVTTLDFAKALIDEGFHPMTMYFPLVVHGAFLLEPTETENKTSIDEFCDVAVALAKKAKAGESTEWFKAKPFYAPVGRCDETTAALKPITRWYPDGEEN